MRKLIYILLPLIVITSLQSVTVCESYKEQHVIKVNKVELKIVEEKVESIEFYDTEVQPKTEVVSRGLPRNVNGKFKTFMDFRTITSKTSKQWALQQDCYTDDDGFRRYDDLYVVAMGTYYSESVGKKFIIHLSGGNSIDVIVGDIKADIHTDNKNMYIPINGNIVEFIVDSKKISKLIKKMGDVSYSEGVDLSGYIIKIEEVLEGDK